MKKFIFIFVVLTSSLLFKESIAIDTLSIKYFPIHVGDFWVYDWVRHTNLGTTVEVRKTKIVGNVNINNHVYYIVNGFPIDSYPGCDTLRTDSISGSLRKYNYKNDCLFYFYEILFDSLAAVLNDSVKNCSPFFGYRCTGVTNVSIFGINVLKKSFETIYHYGGIGISFAQNIGVLYYNNYFQGGGGYGSIVYNLKGCWISGVKYGDTSTTNINKIGEEIPSEFVLNQNYPNPFNPNTIIRFHIKDSRFVELKIFDIIGREITRLVNEKLNTGTYEVNWDGSNFPNGIYFYRLTAGDYTETKRMVLVK